ncbi:chain-length determining protein [Aureimonas endophytica]|uniref:Chain-length determining protein n=1 Tax=Aureimonas endophytica TaxID=2027858 RepID=A0A916ZGS2_9HYPH|nr:GNVR domain-containing protein [Aureimonas endophytica]GGD95875.1 chain-length determining protein [Aureimonas endophytica]
MNIISKDHVWAAPTGPETENLRGESSRIWGAVRRRYPLAIVGAAIAAALAVVMLHFSAPAYQSDIHIVLTEDRTKLLDEISGVETARNADEYIATQIGMISSEAVARRVVDMLDLTHNPVFMAERPSLLNRLRAAIPLLGAGKDEAEKNDDVTTRAVNRLRDGLGIFRVERSLIIEVRYTGPDPILARDIAAAYGRAYLTDQTESHFAAVTRASTWLEGRIEDLRQQSLAASQEVETFRAKNDLVAANGQLVAEQNLAGMNSQMVLAETDYARQKARLQVYEEALNSGSAEDVISVLNTSTELSQSAAIQQLRTEYLQARERERAITERWGEDTPQAVAVRSERQRLSNLLMDEARRAVDIYRKNLEIGQAQLHDLNSTIKAASGKTQTANSTLVTLRSLEQRADSYHALYQSYLTRYQEAVQQQSLPVNTARVISDAQIADAPVLPKKPITVALSLVLGLIAGAAIGVLKEMMDHSFRSRHDVDVLRLDFLGYLPKLGRKALSGHLASVLDEKARGGAVLGRNEARFVEGVRNMKTAIEVGKPHRGKVVGIVSLTSGEGKSVVALNLARLIASGGRRVLLVDGNTQNPELSAGYASASGANFTDVVASRRTIEEAVVEVGNGVALMPSPPLPTGAAPRIATVVPLMHEHRGEWLTRFDMTLVELPPIETTSDAKALAEDLDQVIFVVAWGKTDRGRFEYQLQSLPLLRDKAVGVVMTQVDMSEIHLYDPYFKPERRSGSLLRRLMPLRRTRTRGWNSR